MKIASSNGEYDVLPGAHVDMQHQGQWEVVRISEKRTYGPFSLGGTPIVTCKPIGEPPVWIRRYMNEDGTCDFCGDSIAGALIDKVRASQSESDGLRR